MAINVIGEDKSVVKETSCRNCGARLQYTPSDVCKDYSTDYTGSKDSYSYIPCPRCHKQVIVRNY